MNASSAFVSLNEKKRKKKRMVRNKKIKFMAIFFMIGISVCVLKPKLINRVLPSNKFNLSLIKFFQ